ncbi:hypothetical protein C8R46DRAFT_1037942 [Mycena filopes]|nr:hypothetical protein C8R46DRAFT_1037942 [Mycena filopes]
MFADNAVSPRGGEKGVDARRIPRELGGGLRAASTRRTCVYDGERTHQRSDVGAVVIVSHGMRRAPNAWMISVRWSASAEVAHKRGELGRGRRICARRESEGCVRSRDMLELCKPRLGGCAQRCCVGGVSSVESREEVARSRRGVHTQSWVIGDLRIEPVNLVEILATGTRCEPQCDGVNADSSGGVQRALWKSVSQTEGAESKGGANENAGGGRDDMVVGSKEGLKLRRPLGCYTWAEFGRRGAAPSSLWQIAADGLFTGLIHLRFYESPELSVPTSLWTPPIALPGLATFHGPHSAAPPVLHHSTAATVAIVTYRGHTASAFTATLSPIAKAAPILGILSSVVPTWDPALPAAIAAHLPSLLTVEIRNDSPIDPEDPVSDFFLCIDAMIHALPQLGTLKIVSAASHPLDGRRAEFAHVRRWGDISSVLMRVVLPTRTMWVRSPGGTWVPVGKSQWFVRELACCDALPVAYLAELRTICGSEERLKVMQTRCRALEALAFLRELRGVSGVEEMLKIMQKHYRALEAAGRLSAVPRCIQRLIGTFLQKDKDVKPHNTQGQCCFCEIAQSAYLFDSGWGRTVANQSFLVKDSTRISRSGIQAGLRSRRVRNLRRNCDCSASIGSRIRSVLALCPEVLSRRHTIELAMDGVNEEITREPNQQRDTCAAFGK